MERSTPSAGRVPSGRSDPLQALNGCPAGEGPTSNSNRRTEPRTKDQRQLRRFGPRCLRRTNVNSAPAAIPSWATWGERIILRSCPCNRDHAPRVSMVGNLGKSQTVLSLLPFNAQRKRACNTPFDNCRQIVHKSSLATRRTPGQATDPTVRRSGAPEAQPCAALSACRRVRSYAS